MQHYRWFTKICSSSVMTYKSLLYIITDLLQFFFTSSKIWFFMTYGTSSNGKHWQWKLHIPTVQTCTVELSHAEYRMAPVWISNCLCAPYGSMESIEVAVHVHCANSIIRLMLLSEISDHTNQAWLPCKVGHICWSKYFALQSSIWKNRPWGYSHQPVVECQFENSHLHCL